MTSRSSSTDAIVLRARPLGEADRVYTLLTRERGKVDAVAKGARRPRSAMGGRLEPLAEVRVALHKGRSLDVITEVRTIASYWEGLVRPDALATASLFAETVDLFSEPELALPEIYALLGGAIGAVAASDAPATLVPRFQLRLLHALGLAPADDACVRCGAGFGENPSLRQAQDRLGSGQAIAWLDLEAGGLGCERCYGVRGEAQGLNSDDVANFRALGAERGAGAALRATSRVARAADDIVTWHLGRRPKARALVYEFSS
jgi:DNA repair protein RecO (recombination protein O)